MLFSILSLNQIQNRHDPLLKLMLIFLFYQARFILTFKNIFVLVIDVQQLEKISSLARTKFRPRIICWVWGRMVWSNNEKGEISEDSVFVVFRENDKNYNVVCLLEFDFISVVNSCFKVVSITKSSNEASVDLKRIFIRIEQKHVQRHFPCFQHSY